MMDFHNYTWMFGSREGQNDKKSKWQVLSKMCLNVTFTKKKKKGGKDEIVLIENNRWDIEVPVAEETLIQPRIRLY